MLIVVAINAKHTIIHANPIPIYITAVRRAPRSPMLDSLLHKAQMILLFAGSASCSKEKYQER